MIMNNEQNKQIEDILGSLDGNQRAAVPSFFYTRLRARMEKGYEPATQRSWLLRPAYALAALVLIIAVNAAVIYKENNVKKDITTDTETLQSIAAEYRLNDNGILYDLNQDK